MLAGLLKGSFEERSVSFKSINKAKFGEKARENYKYLYKIEDQMLFSQGLYRKFGRLSQSKFHSGDRTPCVIL